MEKVKYLRGERQVKSPKKNKYIYLYTFQYNKERVVDNLLITVGKVIAKNKYKICYEDKNYIYYKPNKNKEGHPYCCETEGYARIIGGLHFIPKNRDGNYGDIPEMKEFFQQVEDKNYDYFLYHNKTTKVFFSKNNYTLSDIEQYRKEIQKNNFLKDKSLEIYSNKLKKLEDSKNTIYSAIDKTNKIIYELKK